MQEVTMVQSSAFQKNKKFLLALIYLAGGKIRRYSRFQLVVYGLKPYNLHTYKFNEKCSWGPADCKFHSDLHELCGDIIFTLYKDKNEKGESHGEYGLYDAIKSEAVEYAKEIQEENPEGFEKLQEFAKLLGQPPEKITALTFYNRFVQKYSSNAN